MKKVLVTGAAGLIGWHASVRLHAQNCAERFNGRMPPYELVRLDHKGFVDVNNLERAVADADLILHFAGVNRGSQDEVERANPRIAAQLASAIKHTGSRPHLVYANTIHAAHDTPYGRSKREAAERLAATGLDFTNLILPHIFGECAKPYYNNVTATLIDQIIAGEPPTINPDGEVKLLHAGEAAQIATNAGLARTSGDIAPDGRRIKVPNLYDRISAFHQAYVDNIYPDLRDPFDLMLFNSYRATLYPDGFPRPLKLNTDQRGKLFEVVKGGGGGQSFASWTEPGVTRGNHFHLNKVERFLVLEGEAIIRVRRVFDDTVWEYRVSGEIPAPVDMPTLHTHSIENIGEKPLLTMFWTQEIFDPATPDTYADPVLGA